MTAQSFFLFLTTSILAGGATTVGAQERCNGDARIEHNMGIEHFATTSRIYRSKNVHVYETCVENLGKGDLWIKWAIPGPETYVLPGKAVTSERAFITRETIDAVSCLEYGSLASVVRVKYMGHAFDRDAIEKEGQRGCQAEEQRAMAESAQQLPSLVETSVRLYVPSDRKNPSATMLEFNAAISTTWTAELSYKHAVAYSVQQVEGREQGIPANMSIRLADDSTTVYLMENGKLGEMSTGTLLGDKNEFIVAINSPSDPTLKSAKYEILDQDKKVVGAFFAPVWTQDAK